MAEGIEETSCMIRIEIDEDVVCDNPNRIRKLLMDFGIKNLGKVEQHVLLGNSTAWVGELIDRISSFANSSKFCVVVAYDDYLGHGFNSTSVNVGLSK